MSKLVCPSCGKRSATERTLAKYHYKESGLPNLWLHGGVTETECSACKEKLIRIEREGQLLQVLAVELLIAPRPLRGDEMRFLRGACFLSQDRLAQKIRRTRGTITVREKQEQPKLDFADEVLLRLVLLQHFSDHLKGEGNNLLPPNQREILADFIDWFPRFSAEFAKKALSRRPNLKLVAALDTEHVWKLEKEVRPAA